MMAEEFEMISTEDIPEYIKENGLNGIEDLFKAKLEQWKNVGVNIGVTGDSGVGKSSFINAIRGLKDDDEGAAETGITETTREVTAYPHPTNDKIKFWDLPGIGTPNYPDLETYCEEVSLGTYDTFLILTAGRFTENDLRLAKKVKSIKKSFFFVRTKIDQDIDNESQKRAFNEESTLKQIRKGYLYKLKDLVADNETVFLISNRKTAKWDFGRLTQAILDVLPRGEKESLILTLNVLTSRSKVLLKQKVEVLRDRIPMVAGISGAGALVPVPGLSVALDIALLTSEVNFYKSQLGLPEETSEEFVQMTPEIQASIRKFCFTSAVEIGSLAALYAASSTVEEITRYIPIVGSLIAGSISFTSTSYFLRGCLNELEETALKFLDEINAKVADDMDID